MQERPITNRRRWALSLGIEKKRSPIPRKRLNLSLLPPNPSLRTLTSLFVAVMSLERDHYYIFHEGKTLEFSIFSFYMIHLCLNLVFPLITHSHSMKVVMAFILHTKWQLISVKPLFYPKLKWRCAYWSNASSIHRTDRLSRCDQIEIDFTLNQKF